MIHLVSTLDYNYALSYYMKVKDIIPVKLSFDEYLPLHMEGERVTRAAFTHSTPEEWARLHYQYGKQLGWTHTLDDPSEEACIARLAPGLMQGRKDEELRERRRAITSYQNQPNILTERLYVRRYLQRNNWMKSPEAQALSPERRARQDYRMQVAMRYMTVSEDRYIAQAVLDFYQHQENKAKLIAEKEAELQMVMTSWMIIRYQDSRQYADFQLYISKERNAGPVVVQCNKRFDSFSIADGVLDRHFVLQPVDTFK